MPVPYFIQPELPDFDTEHGVTTQSWSPRGGVCPLDPSRRGHDSRRRVAEAGLAADQACNALGHLQLQPYLA